MIDDGQSATRYTTRERTLETIDKDTTIVLPLDSRLGFQLWLIRTIAAMPAQGEYQYGSVAPPPQQFAPSRYLPGNSLAPRTSLDLEPLTLSNMLRHSTYHKFIRLTLSRNTCNLRRRRNTSRLQSNALPGQRDSHPSLSNTIPTSRHGTKIRLPRRLRCHPVRT
jgi:hypothetical protein